MTHHVRWLRGGGAGPLVIAAFFGLVIFCSGSARAADSGFSIQVSPSPLTVTLKPDERKTATLTIRNQSTHDQILVPHISGFVIDKTSQKIDLRPDVPSGLDEWIEFKDRSLTIPPGASRPLEIIYHTPSNVGFSYAVAITLDPPDKTPETKGANYKASVAVFNLINIERADAKKELQVVAFKSDRSRYAFLPASFTLTVQNNGNVIDQPAGNVFIQRSFDDTEPLATIPLNQTNGYILPNTSRDFTSQWADGFPRYESTKSAANTEPERHLRWDWRHMNELRIGKYVAKAVLVYNDGQRDVPLIASTTFWVIPWTLLFAIVAAAGLLITGLLAWGKLVLRGTKKVGKYARRKK